MLAKPPGPSAAGARVALPQHDAAGAGPRHVDPRAGTGQDRIAAFSERHFDIGRRRAGARHGGEQGRLSPPDGVGDAAAERDGAAIHRTGVEQPGAAPCFTAGPNAAPSRASTV